jgi:hypothetical protein
LKNRVFAQPAAVIRGIDLHGAVLGDLHRGDREQRPSAPARRVPELAFSNGWELRKKGSDKLIGKWIVVEGGDCPSTTNSLLEIGW